MEIFWIRKLNQFKKPSCLMFLICLMSGFAYADVQLIHLKARFQGENVQVVSGEVKKVYPPYYQKPRLGNSASQKFDFKVDQVILGDQSFRSSDIVLTAVDHRYEDYPLCKENQYYIAVFGFNYELIGIVPAVQRKYESFTNYDETRGFLVKLLIDNLSQAITPHEKIKYILSVAQVVTKQEVDSLVKYLDDPEKIVKRAALATLLYVTKDPKYLSMAQKDLLEMVNENPEGYLTHVGYSYFFSNLHFDQTPFLSVHRASVLKRKNWDFEIISYDFSVRALLRYGTKEDIPILYKLYMDIRNNKIPSESYGYNPSFVDGLSRILRLNYDTSFYEKFPRRFLVYEEKQFRVVRQEIVKQGIMTEKELMAFEACSE